MTFRYNENADPVLEDIDFIVPKGKTTAIVGGTGSGKSTIAKLLLRLNDVSNGQIKFAGTPITEMNQETLLKLY